MRGIIYKYTSPSEKVYIGQTYNARRKYGPDAFEYEVLFAIETEDKEFDSINSGYNTLEGGTSVYQNHITTSETRAKMSLSNSKPILQFDLNGNFIRRWKSTMEIERELKIQHSLISKNCKRQTSHCRDFIFRYDGDSVHESERCPKLNKTKNVCVIQLEGNKIIGKWKSIATAAIDLGMERHRLSKLLKLGDIYVDNTLIKLE